jgi:LacI family transcriptional regulator
MATTIKKLAEHLGLSPPTVSHILNRRGRFRDETRRRVLQAAEEFGYVPNGAARSMRNQRSQQIGALIRNNPAQRFRNIAAYETILGINEGLEQAGYLLSLVRIGDVQDSDNPKAPQSRAFSERMFDGMIVVSAVPQDVLTKVEHLTPHCVWLDTDVWRPTGALKRDERLAGSMATQALIDLGYRKLLWFGPSIDSVSEFHYSLGDRMSGVQTTVAQHSIQLNMLMEPRETLSAQPQRLIDWLKPEIGVIAYSTSYARWLAHEAGSLGLQPGYDFGLVCCDDSKDLSMQWPGLCRVTFDRFQMGLEAARMVTSLIEGKPCPSQKLRGHWQPGNTAWGPERFYSPVRG